MKYLILVALLIVGCTSPPEEPIEIDLGGFCGESTFGSCNTDADCEIGGCSGQICGTALEAKKLGSTCEWRECYDRDAFGVSCGCIQDQCQWNR